MSKKFIAIHAQSVLMIAPPLGVIFNWLHYFIPTAWSFIVPPDGSPFSEAFLPLVGFLAVIFGFVAMAVFSFSRSQSTALLRVFALAHVFYSALAILIWLVFFGSRLIINFPIGDLGFYIAFLSSLIPHIFWIVFLLWSVRVLRQDIATSNQSNADSFNSSYNQRRNVRHAISLVILVGVIFVSFVYEKERPFHDAVRAGDISKVSELLVQSPDIIYDHYSTNDFYMSPLSIAVKQENEEMVRLLLDAGADVNGHRSEWETPLIIAACSGNVGITSLLIERGADVNERINSINGVAFISAVRCRKIEVMKLFIDKGADVNMMIEAGRGMSSDIMLNTPLKTAVDMGSYESIELLLDNGADVNIKGQNDDAAIHLAAKRLGDNEYYQKIINLLLERGANINEKGYLGKTPLNIASEGILLYDSEKNVDYYEPVSLANIVFLIEAGADINIEDENGLIPLDYAKKNGFVDIANLLSKSADNK